MNDNEKNRFAEAMSVLRDCYPGAWWGDDGEWRRRLKAYWDQLKGMDYRDVVKALTDCPGADFYPDRFPTVGQVQRVAIAAEGERRKREAAAKDEYERRRAGPVEDWTDPKVYYRHIPKTPPGQQHYIEGAANPWEKLARIWECESIALNIHPGQQTPPDVMKARMGQFWKLWDRRSA